MDLRLALMTGIDIPIPECQLTLHQPTIKEISYIGEKVFFTGAQCLCINKSMYEDQMPEATNFGIFMLVMNDTRAVDKKESVQQLLMLLFPECSQIMLSPRAIVFKKDSELLMVDESNFDFLQNVLREVFCLANADKDNYNPANDAAKKIVDKIMKARDKMAKLKENSSDSVFAQQVSILSVGLKSMGIQELLNCTPYQIYDLVERFMLWSAWDLDIRARIAGATSDSKPENWMKNIH